MKDFSLRELTKRGCIRVKEEDFSDDGSRFKVLYYKNLRVTYLKNEGDYFLAIRIPEGENYIYDDYKDQEWYRNCDKYNYCSDIDPDDFINIAEIAISEIEKLESQPKEEIDITNMEQRRLEEIEIGLNILEDFRNSNVIYDMKSEYQVKWILDYYHSLEREIQRLQELDFSKLNYRALKQRRNSFNDYGYIIIKEDDFYIRKLTEAIRGE